MLNHSSAEEREETTHVANSTETNTQNGKLSTALKRRARSIINDRSIDAETRSIIRYGLEINDPSLAELVRRVDEGESLGETMDFSPTSTTEDDLGAEKIELLTELICRAGDEPATKAAALLILMSTLENSNHPKVLANTAKHLAFTRCAELNLYGMVDAQIPVVEVELLAGLA